MVIRKRLFQLSSRIYRVFSGAGIPLPTTQYKKVRHYTQSRGPWSEVKTALLAEIETSRHSTQTTLFNRKLLERIEDIENDRIERPLIDALFNDGPALREVVDPSAELESTITGEFTDSQRHALDLGRRNRVTFVIGASASGKTRITTQLITEYVATGQSVLFCCHTNDALNHALDQLDDETRTSELLQGRTISAVVMDKSQRVVDNIVIDEAGMAHLAQILCLASLPRHRIVFVGDPMQLPPIAHSESELAEKYLRRSIFQGQARATNLSELYFWQARNNNISALLREQFNVSETIAPILNQIAYFSTLNERSGGRGIVTVVDTSSLEATLTGSRSSPINEAHAEIVAAEVSQALTRASVEENLIGVLTPFNGQRRKLEELFKERGLSENLEISTIQSLDNWEIKKMILSQWLKK